MNLSEISDACSGIAIGRVLTFGARLEATYRNGHRTFQTGAFQIASIQMAFESLSRSFESLPDYKLFSYVVKPVAYTLTIASCYFWHKDALENYPLAKRSFQWIRDHVSDLSKVVVLISAVAMLILSQPVAGGSILLTMGFDWAAQHEWVDMTTFNTVDRVMEVMGLIAQLISLGWIIRVLALLTLAERVYTFGMRYFGPGREIRMPTQEEKDYLIDFNTPLKTFMKAAESQQSVCLPSMSPDLQKPIENYTFDQRHLKRGATDYNNLPGQDIGTLLTLFDQIPWEEEVYQRALHTKLRGKQNESGKWIGRDSEFQENINRRKKFKQGEHKGDVVQEGLELAYVQEGLQKLIRGIQTGHFDTGLLDSLHSLQDMGRFIAHAVKEQYDNPKFETNKYLEVTSTLIQLGTRGWYCATGHLDELQEITYKYRGAQQLTVRGQVDKLLTDFRRNKVNEELKKKTTQKKAREMKQLYENTSLSEEFKQMKLKEFLFLQLFRLCGKVIDYESFFDPGESHNNKFIMSIIGPKFGLWDDYRLSQNDRLATVDALEQLIMQKALKPIISKIMEPYNMGAATEWIKQNIEQGTFNKEGGGSTGSIFDWFVTEYQNQNSTANRQQSVDWVNKHLYEMDEDLNISVKVTAVQYMFLKFGIIKPKEEIEGE